MTWGPYWMFYQCPACGKKFKHTLEGIDDAKYGICPACEGMATWKGESKNMPLDAPEYETFLIGT